MTRRMYVTFVTIIFLGMCALIIQLYLVQDLDSEFSIPVVGSELHTDTSLPVILWWNPFGSNGQIKTCGTSRCYFTHDRTFESHEKLKSILFYGSNFRIDDIPNWKSDHVQWGLIHEESPRNNPILVHEEALTLFSYSSTFSRFSNVPLTLVDLPGMQELLETKYFVSTERKNVLMQTENLAPVLYIQSDCDTASDRDSYVIELMKYIKVDSYGSCVNNARLDQKLKENYLEILSSDIFLSFAARYKFTLAFENAVCEDYITEKLWRPLIVGSVPVYYGSPSFKDWLPNDNSAISVRDFSGPAELANLLHDLTKNDTEYEKYLSHKLEKKHKITNYRLIHELKSRSEEVSHDFGKYVNEFECFVCKQVQDINGIQNRTVMTKKQYDCPLPTSPLPNEIKRNWWVDQWNIEKCGAKLLNYYLSNNITIDTKQFNALKWEMHEKNQC